MKKTFLFLALCMVTKQQYAQSPFTTDIIVNGVTIGKGSGTPTYNTATGYNALKLNTTGDQNSAFGYKALINNTTGSYNTAFGMFTLLVNTTGVRNTAVGDFSLESNTIGYSNTALGYQALDHNVSGAYNNAIGHYALLSNAVGNGNFASGHGALYSSTGSYNIGLGYLAAYHQTSGDNNIIIGSNIELPNLTGSNQLNIGNIVYGTGINSSTPGAGKIGIGTMTPTEKFQIGDRFTFSDGGWKGICSNIKWDANLETNVRIVEGPASGMFYTNKGNTAFLNGSTKVAGSTLNDAFYTMVLYNSGQVGVGTSYDLNGFTDQTIKFYVEGGVRARKVRVDQNSFADFVFHKDYHLPTIDSVDRYIQQYQHLPSVPSEKEVKENGVDVSEMNKLLLQKIEELTLYTIDQQKQLDQKNKEIEKINDRMDKLEELMKKMEQQVLNEKK
ncbi:hypothetical protein [Pinibacter aurantiacus]|uniref:Peptidase S74 domain-containing protein n=1 Tax=Pinibacter aurantiacus TaxID=2851599 RepID=A0A9E2SCC2_9BACT|nr:hypothetical protein [Pinibacter aurantiacus]MBV4358899.1 hypothetical protein [Pinibacter aurantiacus]